MWCVVGAGAVPHVPGLVGSRLLGVTNEANCLVGDVFREVIAVVGQVGLLDEMVVLDQLRVPLVGFAADEAVEPVITKPQRPVLAVGADVEGIDGHVVVLADPEGAPAGVAQHRRDRCVLRRDVARVAGKACRRLGDGPETVLMMVAARQHRGAGRRADRGGVPLRIRQPARSQPVQRGHADAPAVGDHAAQTGVVVEDDEDIRRVLRGFLVEKGVPVGRGVADVEFDLAVELPRHGHSSVRSALRAVRSAACTSRRAVAVSARRRARSGRTVPRAPEASWSVPLASGGRLVREVERERAVGGELQLVGVERDGADVVPAVRGLRQHEVVLVVHRQRPEAAAARGPSAAARPSGMSSCSRGGRRAASFRVGAADEVGRLAEVVDVDVDHRRLRAAEPVGSPQARAFSCRCQPLPASTPTCGTRCCSHGARHRLRSAARSSSALNPDRTCAARSACAPGRPSRHRRHRLSGCRERLLEVVPERLRLTHCGRLASGSAAIISAVTPGGNTALRAARLAVLAQRPGVSWLSGNMPIWFSTATRARLRVRRAGGEAARRARRRRWSACAGHR